MNNLGFKLWRWVGRKCGWYVEPPDPEMWTDTKAMQVKAWQNKNPDFMLEPDGGNLYRPHPMMVNSSQFWRCKHGLTGFGKDMNWVECDECKSEDPVAYEKFSGEKPDAANP